MVRGRGDEKILEMFTKVISFQKNKGIPGGDTITKKVMEYHEIFKDSQDILYILQLQKSPKSSLSKKNGNNYCREFQGLLSPTVWNEDKLFCLKLP